MRILLALGAALVLGFGVFYFYSDGPVSNDSKDPAALPFPSRDFKNWQKNWEANR